jgi:transposase-like protein
VRSSGSRCSTNPRRGYQDLLVAAVDGLKGLATAIGTTYARTTVQTRIVRLICNSLEYAGWKDRIAIAQAPRPDLCRRQRRGRTGGVASLRGVPTIGQSWRCAWEYVTPFFVFLPEIRWGVYTTNAIESPNMQLRKIIKTRGYDPNVEAAIKLLLLALRNVLAKSARTAFDWKSAMNQFAILFGEQFTLARR